jgi:hypothetical protein
MGKGTVSGRSGRSGRSGTHKDYPRGEEYRKREEQLKLKKRPASAAVVKKRPAAAPPVEQSWADPLGLACKPKQGKAKGKAKGNLHKGKAKGKGRHSPSLGVGQLRFHDAVERRAAAADNSCAATPASRRSSSCAATPAGERPPGGHWLHAVGGDKAQLMKQSRSWLILTCIELGFDLSSWTKADLAEVLHLQFSEGESSAARAMRLDRARSAACSV